jgi:hypothetical protein
MINKVIKSKTVKLEDLFVESTKKFIDSNKKAFTELVMDSISSKLDGICKLMISQSIDWYKSEIKHFFEQSLKDNVRKSMDNHIKSIHSQVDNEVKILLSEHEEFSVIVKDMVRRKIKGTIKDCLQEEVTQEMINQILDK